MNKIQKTAATTALAVAGIFGLSGCADYEVGQVLQVEEDMGENGPVLELEVSSQKLTDTLDEPASYEVHVGTDSGCEVGDIYDRKSKTCS